MAPEALFQHRQWGNCIGDAGQNGLPGGVGTFVPDELEEGSMQRAFPLTFGKEVCLEPRALQLEPEEVPLRGSTNGDALGDQRISTGEQLQRVAQELLLATGFPELGEGTEDLLPKPAFIGVLLELNGAGFSGGFFPAQGVGRW